MDKKIKVSVRVSEKEYTHLKQQAQISGLKIDPFIRSLIMNANLKPRPPDEYARLLRELSAIGNNVNQIAHIANATQNIDNDKITYVCELVKKAWQHVKGF